MHWLISGGFQETTEASEKGEWIYWQPDLDDNGDGWCAHQTDKNFELIYEHLCS